MKDNVQKCDSSGYVVLVNMSIIMFYSLEFSLYGLLNDFCLNHCVTHYRCREDER
jgi:hypothetical protein